MDIDLIKSRIIEFLRNENLTSAQFAQEIGVQPSSISHIISGRNKPSLEFIFKMISRYPSLSTDWLIFGKGSMFRENISIDLFSEEKERVASSGDIFKDNVRQDRGNTAPDTAKNHISDGKSQHNGQEIKPRTVRIVIFNSDGTFTEHYPG
jgi:transcriptional regulator with XRE-family HTH domain